MTASPRLRLRVVIPVFNDWESLSILMRALDRIAASLDCELIVSVIDDGSTQPDDVFRQAAAELEFIEQLELVQLAVNVGHQRAIAIGLCRAADSADSDAVLVMDSDGEDPPESIPALLERAQGQREFCIVARRRRRSESLAFKASYVIYRSVFRLVTGKEIRFGNFSLISSGNVRRLTMIPDLWNNLAAAVLRSRIPLLQVPIDRGKRYAGRSKMNFTSLIVHGFSAISVYADTIFVRLLLITVVMTCLTVPAVALVLSLRLFVPAHATPGWATTVSFGLIIIVLQALFTTLTSILALLNSRVQRLMLPIVDYKPYVRDVEVLISSRSIA
ncbi:MAG TPA: glycosyltransferase [Acidobacteriaceae bacterium]|nr:glycosyltransferase [Acidobacteriaceae bacterium]